MARRQRSRRSSSRYDYYGGFPRQASVEELQERSNGQLKKLTKEGEKLAPVVSKGRSIATTFWGKAWCTNLEGYADYSNRLPRGRAYLAHGQVLDLRVEKGKVHALVAGSRPAPYRVTVSVHPMAAGRWKEIVHACAGKIDSMIELLQGRLSTAVMQAVTAPKTGMFPSPAEIEFGCSCPDWASMCKHVAASLYGIGARLDDAPELLFLLRGVEPAELLANGGAASVIASQAEHRAMKADSDELSALFGIELDSSLPAPAVKPTKNKTASVTNPLPAPVPAPKAVRKKAAPKSDKGNGPGLISRAELLKRKVPAGVIEFWIEQGLLPSAGSGAAFVLTDEISSRIAKFEKLGARGRA